MRIWLNGKKQSIISKLTSDQQTQEEQASALVQAEQIIETIVEKIIRKGSLLLSLAQPSSFKQTAVDKEDNKESLVKKLSYSAEMKDEDYDKEWQKKVTEWRSNLQELGIFAHRNETLQ